MAFPITSLRRKNNYETEDYSYLLFYYPNKVLETGEVIFDTKLIKMKISSLDGEKIFLKSVKIIKGEMPEKGKDFCVRNACALTILKKALTEKRKS